MLASGAVLVDLPGTQDTNALRGSVAESYLKACNAIWIVSMITRAVNDRAAKACPLPLLTPSCACPWPAEAQPW